MGDEARSINMMRALLAQNPQPSPGLLAQYAALLLRTRQDVELAAQLRQLYGMPLSAQQRSDVDAMRWAYSLRQVDAQREAGNLSVAYEIAAQLLREKPSDASAQQVLARCTAAPGSTKWRWPGTTSCFNSPVPMCPHSWPPAVPPWLRAN